jgi:opacity protein-like surface antigen
MKATIVLLVMGVTVGLGGVATADDDYARRGAYVGGGFLGAINDTDLDDAAGDSLGFDVRGGYRFHPHVAVEGQLSYYDNIGGNFGVADVDLKALTGTANVKGILLPGRVQPYAQVGIGGTYVDAEARFLGTTVAEDSSTEFTFRGGGGVDVYLTPRVSLYTEATYVLLTGDLGGGFVPLVFGAQYHF